MDAGGSPLGARPSAERRPGTRRRRVAEHSDLSWARRPGPTLALGVIRWVMRLAYRLLGRLRVEGAANVPRKGSVILAPNHVSAADWPAVGVAAPRALWFMAKEEMFAMPVLGPLIRICRAFPVRRESADRAALRTTEVLLGEGEAVVIFPEGRVSEDARLQPLKPGVALLALRTGAAVVPVALLGTERLLPFGEHVPRPVWKPVVVRFGPPIPLEDLREPGRPGGTSRASLEDATRRLEEALRALLAGET
jgi:1-acyl-sn-glycerol-3-phosphate acyltransferase